MKYHVNVFSMSYRGERIKHLFDGVVDTEALISIIQAYSQEDYKIEVEMLKEVKDEWPGR